MEKIIDDEFLYTFSSHKVLYKCMYQNFNHQNVSYILLHGSFVYGN